MRLLTPDKLVELCEADTPAIERGARLLGRKFVGGADWIEDGLKKGFYRSEVIKAGDEEKHLLVYHVNDQNSLVVNAAVQLHASPQGRFDDLVTGMEQCARTLGCHAVEGITLRAGVLKQLLAAGFEPVGVYVSKPL